MNIISHRGYWSKGLKANSKESLLFSLENGFGFESDVRDYCEKLVISHNIADFSAIDIEEIFKLLNDFNDKYTFAINIKSDGLKFLLNSFLNKYNIHNYFLFDMSIPQMYEFSEMNFKYFTRQSDIETIPYFYKKAHGIWLDSFISTEWITKDLIKKHLDAGKFVCIVSPELHGNNNYKLLWDRVKKYNLNSEQIMLCTDYPEEARSFFYEKN